jgi:hypothetical protein
MSEKTQMALRELLEHRAALKTELEGIHHQHPDGALPGEAQSRWDRLAGEMDGLEQRISRQSLLDDAERRIAGQPIGGGTGDRHLEQQFAGIGLLDTMRAQIGATDERAGRARELSRKLERRSGRKAEGLLWDMRLGR